ncbi:Uncharacterized protein APZ42_016377 [Daphnia magna]|uniref:Uncharacterized protein n=1 Tax=Daphnia magna TaxID=35525 RepID=A0A165ADX6_9CRUS|nr:Uncharacterized protein APZ42_016377 [Daphnia magna]
MSFMTGHIQPVPFYCHTGDPPNNRLFALCLIPCTWNSRLIITITAFSTQVCRIREYHLFQVRDGWSSERQVMYDEEDNPQGRMRIHSITRKLTVL